MVPFATFECAVFDPFDGAPIIVDVVVLPVFVPVGPNVVLLTIIVELSTQPQSHSAKGERKKKEKEKKSAG